MRAFEIAMSWIGVISLIGGISCLLRWYGRRLGEELGIEKGKSVSLLILVPFYLLVMIIAGGTYGFLARFMVWQQEMLIKSESILSQTVFVLLVMLVTLVPIVLLFAWVTGVSSRTKPKRKKLDV